MATPTTILNVTPNNNFFLSCSVSVNPPTTPTITYQWTGDNVAQPDTANTIASATTAGLFSYQCNATVMVSMLNPVVTIDNTTVTVRGRKQMFLTVYTLVHVTQLLGRLVAYSSYAHNICMENRAVSCDVISMHVHFTVAMLLYCNVQYSMGKKAPSPSLWSNGVSMSWTGSYICIIICKQWMASCLHFFIATVKVLFIHWVLYIVIHQHGRCETDIHCMKLLYMLRWKVCKLNNQHKTYSVYIYISWCLSTPLSFTSVMLSCHERIVTMCMYTQQGYAFGCQKWDLTSCKSPVIVI